jgi:glycosyltransferase involved in cell wall biosynthesis
MFTSPTQTHFYSVVVHWLRRIFTHSMIKRMFISKNILIVLVCLLMVATFQVLVLIQRGVKSKSIIEVPIIYSGHLGSVFEGTGFYEEGVNNLLPLLPSLKQLIIEDNCEGFQRDIGCSHKASLLPTELAQRVGSFASFKEAFSKMRKPLILIRNQPLDWFDAVRTASIDTNMLQPNELQKKNGKWYICRQGKCLRVYRVFRSMFETDSVEEKYVKIMNEQFDEIWVPSEFNRNTFINGGVYPRLLRVVPLAYDSNRFREENVVVSPCKFRYMEKAFIFTSIFKWEDRKGPDVLFKAYLEEFSSNDNVCLVVKTHGSPINGQNMKDQHKQIVKWLRKYAGIKLQRSKDFPCLKVYNNYFSKDEIIAFHKAGDVTVLPTRGEGWGLPYMQSMAFGIPAIGTNWSGNTAFMNESNSFMLNYTRLEQRKQLYGKTAEPDVDHLKKLMRYVYEHPEEVKRKGNIAKEYVRNTFSLERIRDILFAELKRLETLLLSDRF